MLTVRAVAKISDVRLHDLHHTVETYAGQTGAAALLRIYRKLHSPAELPIELSVRPPVAGVTPRHRTAAPTARSFIQCARDIARSFGGQPKSK